MVIVSSSGEEDGDAEWQAAIDSVATSIERSSSNGPWIYEDSDRDKHKPTLKLYQIKAQKLLDDILENGIEFVKDTTPHIPEKDPIVNGGGVRLFKHAPPGIVSDHVDEVHGPQKKPKILREEELDEKSKKFKKQLKSAAVDGSDIIAAARVAWQKSQSKFEAREADAKEKAKREEERVVELKKIRGERWLPSIAREIQVNAEHQKFRT